MFRHALRQLQHAVHDRSARSRPLGPDPRRSPGEGFTPVTQAILGRGDDDFADDDGQYGLSARYYADWLGGTEFGFYYQNYHSRLPVRRARCRATACGKSATSSNQRRRIAASSAASAVVSFATPAGCGLQRRRRSARSATRLPRRHVPIAASQARNDGAVAIGALAARSAARGHVHAERRPISDPGGILANAPGGATTLSGGTDCVNAGPARSASTTCYSADAAELRPALLPERRRRSARSRADTSRSFNGAETAVHAGDGSVDPRVSGRHHDVGRFVQHDVVGLGRAGRLHVSSATRRSRSTPTRSRSPRSSRAVPSTSCTALPAASLPRSPTPDGSA